MLLTDVIKDFLLKRLNIKSLSPRLLPANAFILTNRAISTQINKSYDEYEIGIRAIHVRRLLNYSSVYASSFAPLMELRRFAINRVL